MTGNDQPQNLGNRMIKKKFSQDLSEAEEVQHSEEEDKAQKDVIDSYTGADIQTTKKTDATGIHRRNEPDSKIDLFANKRQLRRRVIDLTSLFGHSNCENNKKGQQRKENDIRAFRVDVDPEFIASD